MPKMPPHASYPHSTAARIEPGPVAFPTSLILLWTHWVQSLYSCASSFSPPAQKAATECKPTSKWDQSWSLGLPFGEVHVLFVVILFLTFSLCSMSSLPLPTTHTSIPSSIHNCESLQCEAWMTARWMPEVSLAFSWLRISLSKAMLKHGQWYTRTLIGSCATLRHFSLQRSCQSMAQTLRQCSRNTTIACATLLSAQ